jgi:hypothetical protein
MSWPRVEVARGGASGEVFLWGSSWQYGGVIGIWRYDQWGDREGCRHQRGGKVC